MSTMRRATKLRERKTPCHYCGFPLTERHHFWPVASFGENECAISICANCHGLYHLVERWLVRGSTRSLKLLDHFVKADRSLYAERMDRVTTMVRQVKTLIAAGVFERNSI